MHLTITFVLLFVGRQKETKALLQALSDEKDDALKRIDSTIEAHAHTLHRRGTLLKNKVIDIYNEHVTKLQADLDEVSTAMTCIVSLKEYHEELIGQAVCHDVDRGIADLDDVYANISEKIRPAETHIVYEDKHGVDKFRMAAKDLGRVRNSRPTAPRSEPEGGRDASLNTTPSTPQQTDAALADVSPASLLHTTTQAGRVAAGSSGGGQARGQGAVKQDSSDGERTHDSREYATARLAQDSNANTAVATCSTTTTTNQTTSTGLDSNSNNTNCPATRPKSFDMTKRKIKNKVNMACDPRAAGRERSAESHSNSNSSSRQAIVPVMKLYDPSRDVTLAAPDVDALKKADKMYHHLVYTSYDEEELLKELKSGKFALTDTSLGMATAITDNDS